MEAVGDSKWRQERSANGFILCSNVLKSLGDSGLYLSRWSPHIWVLDRVPIG